MDNHLTMNQHQSIFQKDPFCARNLHLIWIFNKEIKDYGKKKKENYVASTIWKYALRLGVKGIEKEGSYIEEI